MTAAVSIQTSARRIAPRLSRPIGQAVAGLVASMSSWMRPRQESPADAAARLRHLADTYITQPSFASDLRAAADRHDSYGEGR